MKKTTLNAAMMQKVTNGNTCYTVSVRTKDKQLLFEIKALLDVFEPHGYGGRRGLWIEVPRGHRRTRAPRWYYISVYSHNGLNCLEISLHKEFMCIIDDCPDGYGHTRSMGWFLRPFLDFLEAKIPEIAADVDAYNKYVNENLPLRQRVGRIPRKEFNRIIPWKRVYFSKMQKYIPLLRACIDNERLYRSLPDSRLPGSLPPTYRAPLHNMSIRQYAKYFRIAYNVFEKHFYFDDIDVEYGLPDYRTEHDGEMSDEDYYINYEFDIYNYSNHIDVDSEEDFNAITSGEYGKLGSTGMAVHASEYFTLGEWLFAISINNLSTLATGLEIAAALFDEGCPLIIHNSQKLLDLLEEKDNVLLTSAPYHDNLDDQEEGSVFELPKEDEIEKPYELTREQYDEIVSLARWEPVEHVALNKETDSGYS